MVLDRIRYFRLVSILVIIIFTWQQITWAQGGAPVPEISKPGRAGTSGRMVTSGKMGTASLGAIPHYMTITREISEGLTDELIINIQDAHDSLNAQY